MKQLSKIVLITIIASGVAYWYFVAQPNESKNNTPPLTTSSETANWVTYKNEQYGFEFKHPAEWEKNWETSGPNNTFKIWFGIPQSDAFDGTLQVEMRSDTKPLSNKSENEIYEDIYKAFSQNGKTKLTHETKIVGSKKVLRLTNTDPVPGAEPTEMLIVINTEKTKMIGFSITASRALNFELGPKLELIASTLLFD